MTYPFNAPLLDFLILSIIGKEDSYGYQISQQLKSVAAMKDSTLYPILKRLSDNGFVDTYDQPFQGRNRKYYRITESGKKQQEFLLSEWKAYTQAIDCVIYGEETTKKEEMRMNKTEYMEELAKRLRHLPKEDFQKAIDYYEEYFADAGVENEAQVIEDLGTPDFAARQIVTDIAINNTKEPSKDIKKGLNSVWVGILAVCAAPIALPVAFAFAITIAAFILTILLLLGSLILAGAVLVLAGPISIFAGFSVLSSSVPVFISCLGMGLFSIGLGLVICSVMIRLCQLFLAGMVKFFGNFAKGRMKNEKNK